MLDNINVRFFCMESDPEINEVEISHDEFTEIYAISESFKPRLDIVKYSLYANGCRQLCITLWVDRETAEPV